MNHFTHYIIKAELTKIVINLNKQIYKYTCMYVYTLKYNKLNFYHFTNDTAKHENH